MVQKCRFNSNLLYVKSYFTLNESSLLLIFVLITEMNRKLSTQEKKGLSAALGRLSPEDLSKALKMVSEGNPQFPAGAPEVELDIDLQVNTKTFG